jgi:hypothetical protein
MKIGRGNRSARRKPAPAPLCPSQIPLDRFSGGKPAANRMSYGMIMFMLLDDFCILLVVLQPWKDFMEGE